MNEYRIADVFIGLEENFQVMVTEEMLATFAKLTGDYNPLQQEKEFAKKYGIPVRTLEDWECRRRNCPAHVELQLQRAVDREIRSQ